MGKTVLKVWIGLSIFVYIIGFIMAIDGDNSVIDNIDYKFDLLMLISASMLGIIEAIESKK